MTTRVSKPPARRGQYVWLKPDVYEQLKEYRRGEEHLSDAVGRLIRFAKRYAHLAQATFTEEFLP